MSPVKILAELHPEIKKNPITRNKGLLWEDPISAKQKIGTT
jgi:hypothetical protein